MKHERKKRYNVVLNGLLFIPGLLAKNLKEVKQKTKKIAEILELTGHVRILREIEEDTEIYKKLKSGEFDIK